MDETDQLAQGMAGPFLVLEPGERFDPDRDRVVLIGGQQEGEHPVTINGLTEPPPQSFLVGTTYNLRLIHITRGVPIDISLVTDGVPVRWRPRAKDGADLPPALQRESDASIHTNTGETFDFAWTPDERGEATLFVRFQTTEGEEVVRTQTFRILPN
jgi:hypothetical protein